MKLLKKTHFLPYVENIEVNGLVVTDVELVNKFDDVCHAIILERVTTVCVVFTLELPGDKTEDIVSNAAQLRNHFTDLEVTIMGQEEFRKIR